MLATYTVPVTYDIKQNCRRMKEVDVNFVESKKIKLVDRVSETQL